MKISSVSSVGGAYKTAEKRPQQRSAASGDNAAKASAVSAVKTSAANAAQEAKETVAQTVKEAASGDQQAVKLLAREKAAAAKSAPAATGSRRLDIKA